MKTKMLIKFLIIELFLMIVLYVLLSKALFPEIANYISMTRVEILSIMEHFAYWFAFAVYSAIGSILCWVIIGIAQHYTQYKDI